MRPIRIVNAHDHLAGDLISQHGMTRQLRTLDAIQLAVALRSIRSPRSINSSRRPKTLRHRRARGVCCLQSRPALRAVIRDGQHDAAPAKCPLGDEKNTCLICMLSVVRDRQGFRMGALGIARATAGG